jgi:hypothetical protein
VPENHSDCIDVTAWPNPFTERVTLKWELKANTCMAIEMLDANGRLVKVIAHSVFTSGFNQIEIMSESFPEPGIYFIRMRGEGKPSIIRLLHIN